MTTNTTTKATPATSTAKGAVSKSARKATTTEVALTDAELKAQAVKLAEAYTEAASQEATTLAAIADLSTVVGVARVYMARTAYRLATHPAVLTDYAAKRIINANVKAKATGGEIKPLANISGAITLSGAKKTAYAIAFDGGARLAKASDVDVEATTAPTAREIELVAAAWKADADRKAKEAKVAKAPKATTAGNPGDADGESEVPADATAPLGSDALIAVNRYAAIVKQLVAAGATVSQGQMDAIQNVFDEATAELATLISE